MAPSKKSLADQLADLDNTAPQDYDPEDLVEPLNDSTLNDNNQSSDEEEKGEKDVRGHYVKVGKSKLRNNQPFLMDDPRYAGQRKSRKDIYSDNEEIDEDEEEQEDDIMEEDDSDDNISWEGFDQQETLDIDDNDSEEEDEDESGEEEEEEENDDNDDDDDDEEEEEEEEEEDNELKEQLLKLQKDEKEMMSQLAKNTSGDIEKGQHVKQQLTLFDNCLESRIRIQKAIELSNQLPQNQQYKEIIENNDEVREDVLKVRNELRDVIDELMNMRTSLLGENDAIDLGEVSYNTRKRYLDDDDEDNDEEYIKALWDDISQVNDVFVPFRNSTLEKWSNKVQAASSARLNKKFKAFDQNILTQIDNIMQDKEGLIKRTRLQRADYKILGKKKEEAKQNDDGEESTNKKSSRYLDTYDEEIFDDNDFYQQQLRELIESRMVDTDDPIASGMRWAASKKQEIKKKKKNIDTKASKGRKLR
ncbi:apoptosis antagonizing transcription factor-domain-containing protein [Cunninghamella echinulata]|nr:apoptosis antagonizing transcription factor-domain-containing protein [Cunninghamella echinulata]